MADEIKMPTRWETITRTAKRLVPGEHDAEMLVAAVMSVGTLLYSLGVVLGRLVLFLTMPLSLLALYPFVRANQRRWYKWATGKEEERQALIAELTKVCAKPVDWPHKWREIHVEEVATPSEKKES